MKISLIHKRICLIIIFILLFTLSACSEEVPSDTAKNEDGVFIKENPVVLAIILGNHANAMAIPDDVYKQIDTMLPDVVYGGYACVIISDGSPTKIDLLDSEAYKEDARNKEYYDKIIKLRSTKLSDAIKAANTPANSPEVDLLQAIREAVSALNSAAELKTNGNTKSIEKRIVIVDTGISTAGDIDFSKMDFITNRPSPATIINILKEYEGTGVLPNLTGFSIRFIGTADGLAEVAEPQELGTTDRAYLLRFWEDVVTACGAESVSHSSTAGWTTPNIYTGEADSEFPFVASITFMHDDIFPEPPNGPNDPSTVITPDPPVLEIAFEERGIGFAPGKCGLLNPDAAKQQLKPYAKDLINYLDNHPNEYIWLVGTTAHIQTDAGDPVLSMNRAEALKDILVKFGVPEERLITIGMGAVFPWYDDSNLQKNRSVWMLNCVETNEKYTSIVRWFEEKRLLPQSSKWVADAINLLSN